MVCRDEERVLALCACVHLWTSKTLHSPVSPLAAGVQMKRAVTVLQGICHHPCYLFKVHWLSAMHFTLTVVLLPEHVGLVRLPDDVAHWIHIAERCVLCNCNEKHTPSTLDEVQDKRSKPYTSGRRDVFQHFTVNRLHIKQWTLHSQATGSLQFFSPQMRPQNPHYKGPYFKKESVIMLSDNTHCRHQAVFSCVCCTQLDKVTQNISCSPNSKL